MASSNNPLNLPEFRAELAGMFDEKLTPVVRLLEKHEAQLREHEAALQRARGAKWAFGVVWAVVSMAWEWFWHSGRHS